MPSRARASRLAESARRRDNRPRSNSERGDGVAQVFDLGDRGTGRRPVPPSDQARRGAGVPANPSKEPPCPLKAGLWADIIAVEGNPLDDIRLLERAPFVMKGGVIDKAPGGR